MFFVELIHKHDALFLLLHCHMPLSSFFCLLTFFAVFFKCLTYFLLLIFHEGFLFYEIYAQFRQHHVYIQHEANLGKKVNISNMNKCYEKKNEKYSLCHIQYHNSLRILITNIYNIQRHAKRQREIKQTNEYELTRARGRE